MKIVHAVSLPRNMLPDRDWVVAIMTEVLEESFSLHEFESSVIDVATVPVFVAKSRWNFWPCKSFCSSSYPLSMEMIRKLYKRQKNSRDWQWRDAKIIYFFFGVLKMYALKLWTGSMNSLILISECHIDTKWGHSHIDTKWCNINFNNFGTFSGDVGSLCLF
jgi:hypothetical protein